MGACQRLLPLPPVFLVIEPAGHMCNTIVGVKDTIDSQSNQVFSFSTTTFTKPYPIPLKRVHIKFCSIGWMVNSTEAQKILDTDNNPGCQVPQPTL